MKLLPRLLPSFRRIHTSVVRYDHDTKGIFGSNLPFPVENSNTFLAIFCVYCASGLAVPYLLVRHMALKKSAA